MDTEWNSHCIDGMDGIHIAGEFRVRGELVKRTGGYKRDQNYKIDEIRRLTAVI